MPLTMPHPSYHPSVLSCRGSVSRSYGGSVSRSHAVGGGISQSLEVSRSFSHLFWLSWKRIFRIQTPLCLSDASIRSIPTQTHPSPQSLMHTHHTINVQACPISLCINSSFLTTAEISSPFPLLSFSFPLYLCLPYHSSASTAHSSRQRNSLPLLSLSSPPYLCLPHHASAWWPR